VATEVFEGATVVETVLEKVDDFLVGNIEYSGALVEKAPHVLAQGLALFLLHHGQVHASTRASHGAREVAGELLLKPVPLVDRVLLKRLEPFKWSFVQTEREVEAFCVVVATSVLDGEGVAFEPLYWILFPIVLGDPRRLEFLWEQQIAKSSREGGEAFVLACRG
jgi:hypothetical protein